MKNIFEFVIIVCLMFYFAEYIQKTKQKSLLKPSYKMVKLAMFNVDQPSSVPYNKETSNETSLSDNHTVIVRALGNVDYGDLDFAADIIRDFYGYNVDISTPIDIEENMLSSDGGLISTKACYNLPVAVKTVFITDKLLYDEKGILLRGVTSGNEKTIIVRGEKRFMKETIIHEIGHSLGLGHCNDETCIMAIHNDETDSGNFCSVCRTKINF